MQGRGGGKEGGGATKSMCGSLLSLSILSPSFSLSRPPSLTLFLSPSLPLSLYIGLLMFLFPSLPLSFAPSLSVSLSPPFSPRSLSLSLRPKLSLCCHA